MAMQLLRPDIPAHQFGQTAAGQQHAFHHALWMERDAWGGRGFISFSSALGRKRHRADAGGGRYVAASPEDIKQLTGGSADPHAPPAIEADGSPAGTVRRQCRRVSANNMLDVSPGLQAGCHPLSVAQHVGYARA